MVNDVKEGLKQFIYSKYITVIIDCTNYGSARVGVIKYWEKMKDGNVMIIYNTNPKTYKESIKYDVFKVIHQIDDPPKFTVDNVTVIRKTGELILSDGVIEWEGFDMFRNQILHLVTMEEAIKIIDGWK